MCALGHELPRRSLAAAAALLPITDTKTGRTPHYTPQSGCYAEPIVAVTAFPANKAAAIG
jgi:hypothetical protein